MTGLIVNAQNEEQMVSLGKALGACLEGQMTVFLQGDLGAGKTTLTRGVLQAFGHSGPVKSPTYTLVEPYQLEGKNIYHFDLYRLGHPEELEYMGIRDYFSQQSLCLIEWPERGEQALPQPDLIITITVADTGRQIDLQPISVRGQNTVQALEQDYIVANN